MHFTKSLLVFSCKNFRTRPERMENVCALNKKGCGFESLDASCVCNFDLVCDATDVGFEGT